MSFIDEVEIVLKAGRGGDGIVSWLHEKNKEYGGPAGGDGGKGGDVYIRSARDISVLRRYRFEKEFEAGRGENGKRKSRHGADGKDIEIVLPVGSIVTDTASGKSFELLKDSERLLVLHGGKGGYGNKHFKGSLNVRPRQSTPGKPGEEAVFAVELRLVADAGLIGLPNAGKSSLLNELSRAGAKVGSYEFTTLEPNLGDFYGYIIADIPGLIEGASRGRGLGHKFLRHIERTKILLHSISLEHDDIVTAYDVVREELRAHNPKLMEKSEAVILTKTDCVSSADAAKKTKQILKKCPRVLSVSILDDESLKKFKKNLLGLLKKGN